ncbi:hypothetical protein LX36DRAFT_319745 [Colletotrichum falcatum]|nr:hypothetical protein LX36DRAFT_319745 [Colletotrichum falcatum]
MALAPHVPKYFQASRQGTRAIRYIIQTCPGLGFATGRGRELGRDGTYLRLFLFLLSLSLSLSVCVGDQVPSAILPAELCGLYSVRIC